MKRLFVLLLAAVTMIFAVQFSVGADPYYTNAAIESVYFVAADGNVVVNPEGENDLIPQVVIAKKAQSPVFSGIIIVAAYQEGELYDVTSADIDASALVSGEWFATTSTDRYVYKTPALKFPAVGGSVQAFFWEDLSSATPYVQSVSYNAKPATVQPVGEITFPEPFYSKMNGKFTITKGVGTRQYTHNATPDSVIKWTGNVDPNDDATEVFFTTGSSNSAWLGTNSSQPILGVYFCANYKAGKYKKADGVTIQDKYIFTLVDDFFNQYFANGGIGYGLPFNAQSADSKVKLYEADGTTDADINVLVRSGSPSGFTWIGHMPRQSISGEIATPWDVDISDYPTVYKTTTARTLSITTALNFNAKDAYGNPVPYAKASSLADCQARKGTFWQVVSPSVSKTVYVNLRDGETISDVQPVAQTGPIDGLRNGSKKTVVFQNIGFLPRVTGHAQYRFAGADSNARFGFFGCKFVGGANYAVNITGNYSAAYMFDCTAAYSARRGFQYMWDSALAAYPTDKSAYPVIFEVGCKSYGHGSQNFVYENGVSVNGTDNYASGSQNGISILRVGGKYWNAQGAVVKDSTTLAINLGCEAYNYNNPDGKNTAEGVQAFFVTDEGTSGTAPRFNDKKFIVDCLGTGKGMRYGLQGNGLTYALDFMGAAIGISAGSTPVNTTDLSWSDITTGAWK